MADNLSMRLAIFSLICSVSLANAATLENLNVSMLGSDQRYSESLYKLSDGEPWVIYGFRPDGWTYPCQIWNVSLSNHTSQVFTLTNGFPSETVIIPTAIDSVVYGTVDTGHLYEFFPKTGAISYIKKCSNSSYQNACLGTDGVVALGTYGGLLTTAVETYDPATQTFVEYGKLDVGQTEPVYIYSIGADSGAVYGAIRNPNTPFEWYLGIVQKSDSAKVLYFRDSEAVEIYKGLANNNWYVYQRTNSITRYWQLDGTNTPTLLGAAPSMETWYKHANRNRDPDTWASVEGWEVQPYFAVVEVAGSIPQASVQFRKTGETDWSVVTQTNDWVIGPYKMLKLVPLGNSLIWTADSYGPIGTMTRGGALTLIGNQAGLSWYDILVSSPTDVYFAGYHNRTKRWNPSQFWTYSPTTEDTDLTANPHMAVFNTLGKYHFYLAKAADGRIYIGSHHERGSSGGELGWFDPSDGSVGEERTTFLSYDVRDLKPAVGGTKMVYVSSNTDGKVFIWDVATDTVDSSFSPLGAASLDKVVEYESGKMFGITGNRTFAFDLGGSLLWEDTIPSTAWGTGNILMASYDHRLTLGPDGYVYQCAGGNLYKIKPQDGTYESIISTTQDYNTVFLGGDLFFYGREDVMKLASVVATSSRATNLNVGTLRGR